jgi:hypothetical protein
VSLRLLGTYTRTVSRAHRGFIMPGAIWEYTFSGAGPAGDRSGEAVSSTVVAAAGADPGSRRDAADVQPPSSPDPPANAASAVIARLRVRTEAADRTPGSVSVPTP